MIKDRQQYRHEHNDISLETAINTQFSDDMNHLTTDRRHTLDVIRSSF